MKNVIERKVWLGDEFATLIWDNGKFGVRDLEIESEVIAHTLSNQPMMFSLILLRVLERELKNTSKEEFIARIDAFESFAQTTPTPSQPLSSALLSCYQNYQPSVFDRSDIPLFVYKWYVDNLDMANYPQWIGHIVQSMASSKHTPKDILTIIASSSVHTPTLVAIYNNPNTPKMSRLQLMSNSAFSLQETIIKDWQGSIPSEIVDEIVKNSREEIIEMLARKELEWNGYSMVLDRAKKSNYYGLEFDIKHSLARNPHLSEEVMKELAQDSSNTIVRCIAVRKDLPEEVIEIIASNEELYISTTREGLSLNKNLAKIWQDKEWGKVTEI